MALSGTSFAFNTANDYVTQQGVANTGYDYQTLSSGFTYVMQPNTYDLILNPSGLLALGTVQLPATTQNGKIVEIISTKLITLLNVTCAAGDTIVGATPATLTASMTLQYKYLLPYKMWVRKS